VGWPHSSTVVAPHSHWPRDTITTLCDPLLDALGSSRCVNTSIYVRDTHASLLPMQGAYTGTAEGPSHFRWLRLVPGATGDSSDGTEVAAETMTDPLAGQHGLLGVGADSAYNKGYSLRVTVGGSQLSTMKRRHYLEAICSSANILL